MNHLVILLEKFHYLDVFFSIDVVVVFFIFENIVMINAKYLRPIDVRDYQWPPYSQVILVTDPQRNWLSVFFLFSSEKQQQAIINSTSMWNDNKATCYDY